MSTAQIINADSRHLPIDDETIDLIVTSPPYFGLRSYKDNGQHYGGQIGSEDTPAQFVDALLDVTREMVRVLKPSGSIWVNLGDKYSHGSRPRNQPDQFRTSDEITYNDVRYVDDSRPETTNVAGKSLVGVPWRYAIRCIDELGLILRAEVIWSKPNGLPESVTDRVRRSHETWFHFVRNPKYFAAMDGMRGIAALSAGADNDISGIELGALPGSVWQIATEPLRIDASLGFQHFAAFPTELPRRIISGWSPAAICTRCEQGLLPVVRTERVGDCRERRQSKRDAGTAQGQNRNAAKFIAAGHRCGCTDGPALLRPAIVLDPFGGTGTTAAVAKALGRVGISVDMSTDYCRFAEWRCNGDGFRQILAKVSGIKPATVDPLQMALDI